MQPDPTTIVFDTDCVLCSGMVHFIVRHERAPTIRFVDAWSETGLSLASAHGLTRADLDTTYLVVENGQGFTKSTASLAIARHLRAPWSWLGALKIVPRPLRDAIYTVIAKRRYQWFGHKTACFLPPPGTADRFVNH